MPAAAGTSSRSSLNHVASDAACIPRHTTHDQTRSTHHQPRGQGIHALNMDKLLRHISPKIQPNDFYQLYISNIA